MSFGIPVRNGLAIGLLSSTTLSSNGGLFPAMALDFLQPFLDSRITFTRGTTATFVGSNGFIQTAAINAPRFDYDPVTLAPKGLLIEEQRTNLALTSAFQTLAGSAGSQYPSGTGWSNFFSTGGTRTYVASSVFAGAQAMDIVGVTAARNVIGFSFAAASSTTYTVSFYVESVSGVTGVVAYATGTLGTGGTTNNVTAPTTTGRYTYTFTTGTSAGTVDLRFGIGSAANESGSIRISNVQCEAGAFATSYIPTIASTVTRSADVATITGTNFSSWFNVTEGTFTFNGDSAYGSGGFIGSTPTTGAILYANTNASRTFNGTNFISSANTYTNNTAFNTALGYSAAGRAIVLNGGTVASDANLIQTPTAITLGGAFGGGYLNGHIRSVTYYPVRAADFQLQALSA